MKKTDGIGIEIRRREYAGDDDPLLSLFSLFKIQKQRLRTVLLDIRTTKKDSSALIIAKTGIDPEAMEIKTAIIRWEGIG